MITLRPWDCRASVGGTQESDLSQLQSRWGTSRGLGKPSLHPSCRKWGFISIGGFGPNQAGNKPFWKCPQTGNSQKASETSKPFQNTVPCRAAAEHWHRLWQQQQHLHTAAPHSGWGSSQSSLAPVQRMLRTPWEGCPEPQLQCWECRSSSEASAKLSVLPNMEIAVEFRLPAQPCFQLYSLWKWEPKATSWSFEPPGPG